MNTNTDIGTPRLKLFSGPVEREAVGGQKAAEMIEKVVTRALGSEGFDRAVATALTKRGLDIPETKLNLHEPWFKNINTDVIKQAFKDNGGVLSDRKKGLWGWKGKTIEANNGVMLFFDNLRRVNDFDHLDSLDDCFCRLITDDFDESIRKDLEAEFRKELLNFYEEIDNDFKDSDGYIKPADFNRGYLDDYGYDGFQMIVHFNKFLKSLAIHAQKQSLIHRASEKRSQFRNAA